MSILDKGPGSVKLPFVYDQSEWLRVSDWDVVICMSKHKICKDLKEPRPAQICTAYRCDHCEVDAGHYTCDNLLMEKKTLCDGISHCPKAEDENCYKPCCDGIELELDGQTHYLMKKQLTEEDTDVKDSYFQVWLENDRDSSGSTINFYHYSWFGNQKFLIKKSQKVQWKFNFKRKNGYFMKVKR